MSILKEYGCASREGNFVTLTADEEGVTLSFIGDRDYIDLLDSDAKDLAYAIFAYLDDKERGGNE